MNIIGYCGGQRKLKFHFLCRIFSIYGIHFPSAGRKKNYIFVFSFFEKSERRIHNQINLLKRPKEKTKLISTVVSDQNEETE